MYVLNRKAFQNQELFTVFNVKLQKNLLYFYLNLKMQLIIRIIAKITAL